MDLFFITSNPNKLREAKEILNLDIKQLDIDLPEIQELDPRKIIQEKINEAIKHHKGKFIIEDTSLYINSMNGLPGPLIKWFVKSLGMEGIYQMAKHSGDTKARASTIIGYYDGNSIHFVEGITHGEIVKPNSPSKFGFGWDPIFKPEGQNKTYAEMTPEEKNAVSQRGRAFYKLKKMLKL